MWVPGESRRMRAVELGHLDRRQSLPGIGRPRRLHTNSLPGVSRESTFSPSDEVVRRFGR